ncbi:MAG TPA: hypothetical protein VEX57_01585 [Microlunatus sp.]|nr:hypothetical protein [Microlunatus sp.]
MGGRPDLHPCLVRLGLRCVRPGRLLPPHPPLFRAVSNGNRALDRRLSAVAVNKIIQAAAVRGGLVDDGQVGGYSAHSLRAGFVTYAHSRGASDRAIAHQTRHRSLHTVGTYIRVDTAWDDNAATVLGL